MLWRGVISEIPTTLTTKKGYRPKSVTLCITGAPGRIRTYDPLVRSQVLYPSELRAPLRQDQEYISFLARDAGDLGRLNCTAHFDIALL